ncbi:hypothetical protein [Chryseolinea sp. H1M3-3]|uniref:hypothetical protein n=1 Tax=Chryseolinea sp. H1M3-3 TaxID=3034144 RepID=UPI0023EDB829|nr:hypothetical protein [Chryseolinea sp. H1M3-3]
MVRSVIIVGIAVTTIILSGANFKNIEAKEIAEKKNCRGYSVIEVDKGIDCNGDTIKLTKVNGFFERVN